jgi:uncharacterized 2Fe-2S/4Fe-4S cluster protein (DUF4445 family)
MENLTLFGIALGALAMATIKLVKDKAGLTDEAANFIRAVVGAGIYLVIQNAEAIQAAWPYFEMAVTQVGGALSVFLSILGYWDDVQRIGYKVTGRKLPLKLQ